MYPLELAGRRASYVCVCVCVVCVSLRVCVHTYICSSLSLSLTLSHALSLSLSLSLELAGSRASLEQATHGAERADSNVAMHSWEHARKHPRLPNPLTHLCRYLRAVVA